MIEEEELRPPPSRWPAVLAGIALGALATIIVVLVVGREHYVPRNEAKAYLAERGQTVLPTKELEALKARPEECPVAELCGNQIDINRRMKMRFQALEESNLRLIKERNEYQIHTQQIRQRLTSEWAFVPNPQDPSSYMCMAGGVKVGTWHSCAQDRTCNNPELTKALCVYRYRNWILEK